MPSWFKGKPIPPHLIPRVEAGAHVEVRQLALGVSATVVELNGKRYPVFSGDPTDLYLYLPLDTRKGTPLDLAFNLLITQYGEPVRLRTDVKLLKKRNPRSSFGHWLYRDLLLTVTGPGTDPSYLYSHLLPKFLVSESFLGAVVLAAEVWETAAYGRVMDLAELVERDQAASINERTVRQFVPTSGRRALPRDVQRLVFTRDGGRCVYCGRQADLQFDHIIPVSLGGNDHADNLQVLCRMCNQEKGARF